MTRVAAVDIGTNSARLLIADVVDGVLSDVTRLGVVTGLGRGVSESGRLGDEGISRALLTLAAYGEAIDRAGVVAARVVATSASRDAENRESFFEGAEGALGVRPELITGTEEGELSFLGATHMLADPAGAVVIDTGGGSTEFAAPDRTVSVDMGSVRLTDQSLPGHPPTSEQLAAARVHARETIEQANVPAATTAIGVAGTWTSLAAIDLDLDAYDSASVEGHELDSTALTELVARLAPLTLEQKEAIPSLDPRRAPVILGGAVVAAASAMAIGADRVIVSEHDILDGIALTLAS